MLFQHLFLSLSLSSLRAYPFDVVPYGQQQYYWPDTTHGPYYGIFPKVGGKKNLSDLRPVCFVLLLIVDVCLFMHKLNLLNR